MKTTMISLLLAVAALTGPACTAEVTEEYELDEIGSENVNYLTEEVLWQEQFERTNYRRARTFNRVWRPAGNRFEVFYTNSPFYEDLHAFESGTSNPLVMVRDSWGYAGCHNISGQDVFPVTCQTDHP